MLYCLSILFFVVLVILLNLVIFNFATNIILSIILMVVLSVVAVVAIDGLFAFIVRWLMPEKWFNHNKKGFVASRKECLFYEKIGIKKWKDKILELGFFAKFRKNKIAEPTNNDYVKRYIIELNYGIVVHLFGCIFGFLIIVIYPSFWLTIGIPVGIVNVLYNCLSIFILRYNLPKLHKLYELNERREARAKAKAA